jgi:hypothetical protein
MDRLFASSRCRQTAGVLVLEPDGQCSEFQFELPQVHQRNSASAHAGNAPHSGTSVVGYCLLLAILPRSLHLPAAVTDGSLTENLNKTGVRLWTDRSGNRQRETKGCVFRISSYSR